MADDTQDTLDIDALQEIFSTPPAIATQQTGSPAPVVSPIDDTLALWLAVAIIISLVGGLGYYLWQRGGRQKLHAWYSNRTKNPLHIDTESLTSFQVVPTNPVTIPHDILSRHTRVLLDKIPVAGWVRNAKLQLVYCNQTYAAQLDSTPQQVLVSQSELAEDIITLAEAALADDRPQQRSMHIVSHGERRFVDVHEMPIIDGSGTIGYALDSSALADIRQQEEKQRLAFSETLEFLDTGIAFYDKHHRLQFFNAAFCDLWKLSAEWLTQKPDYTEVLSAMASKGLLPKRADSEAFRQQQLRLFKNLQEPQQNFLTLDDNRTMRQAFIPHHLGGVVITYDLATAANISTGNTTNPAHDVVTNLDEALLLYEAGGTIILSNPAFHRLWQLDAAVSLNDLSLEQLPALLNTRFGYETNSDAYTQFAAQFLHMLQHNSNQRGRLEFQDETLITYDMCILPDGRRLLRCKDITPEASMEKALVERNAALEEADRLKAEFIAHMSYQLRNPLNVINGYTELLLQQADGTHAEALHHIHQASNQLQNYISDLLDLAAFESGHIALHRRETDIAILLQEVASYWGNEASARKQSITIHAPASLVAVVDARRLIQALGNLLRNAITYAGEGAQIALTARKVSGMLELLVSDNGKGIPDDVTVFEKFSRGHNAAHIAGTGLGLVLVKKYIELHHGHVSITSNNLGTTVLCRLPL